MKLLTKCRYRRVIEDIDNLNWAGLGRAALMDVAYAYYYFSVQFRENLELACELHPWDEKLLQLHAAECATDNLSPFPGIAVDGERMNHDAFMWRIVESSHANRASRDRVGELGKAYLAEVRLMDARTRAASISSYEDGGLECVFKAILRAPDWSDPPLQAFRHFLVEHIRFDADAELGHGALSRHLAADDRIYELWRAFRDLLVGAAPALLG